MTSDLRDRVSMMEMSAGTDHCRPIVESKRLPCDACGAPMEPEHAHSLSFVRLHPPLLRLVMSQG